MTDRPYLASVYTYYRLRWDYWSSPFSGCQNRLFVNARPSRTRLLRGTGTDLGILPCRQICVKHRRFISDLINSMRNCVNAYKSAPPVTTNFIWVPDEVVLECSESVRDLLDIFIWKMTFLSWKLVFGRNRWEGLESSFSKLGMGRTGFPELKTRLSR